MGLAEHIRLCNAPHARLDPPIILRAGAATLQDNSELLEVRGKIELRGYRHQFIGWAKHDIQKEEYSEFAKWQITTPRAAKTILTENEREEVVKWFRSSKEDR